jgi:hypothetical protein
MSQTVVRRWSVCGLVLAGLICGPSTVSANRLPAHSEDTASTIRFSLQATKGYQVSVVGSQDEVSLRVAKGNAGTSYRVPGEIKGDHIGASFPGLGEISAEFYPKGSTTRNPSRSSVCGRTMPTSVQAGVVVGRIRFRGEGGYVSVAASHAKATMQMANSSVRCVGHRDAAVLARQRKGNWSFRPGGASPATILATSAPKLGTPGIIFSAAEASGARGKVFFVATAIESVGSMVILRSAERVESGGSLAFCSDGSVARLRPKAPFSGTGTFRQGPDGNGWSGNLTVSFPGKEGVPLTGAAFSARAICGA